MDERAAKLANARKKLRDHQEKKSVSIQKDEVSHILHNSEIEENKKCEDNSVITKDQDNLLNFNRNINQPDVQEAIIVNHDTPSANNNGYANVTEILISTKTNLEMQNKELHTKIAHLELICSKEADENKVNKQKLTALELQLNETLKRNTQLTETNSTQDETIMALKSQIKSLTDDKKSLIEQQEIAQTILTAKEMEVAQLHSQLSYLENQIEFMKVQLQQLTNDATITLNEECTDKANEILVEKIATLKHQIENAAKEKDLITSHYEHYVGKLNDQLNLLITQNDKLSAEVYTLQNREHSLVKQISQVEIHMQNYRRQTEECSELNTRYKKELKDKVGTIQAELDEWINKYNDLQKQHESSLNEIQKLTNTRTQELSHENISLTKLNADITSDKVAVQRATEQNKKLKVDVEELQQIVVKLGKDKLELTEKLSHEKQLNKQLILKLAEIDETLKQMQTKITAKDEEMIRLQSNYRDIESKHETLLENLLQEKETAVRRNIHKEDSAELKNNGEEERNLHLIKPTTFSECHDPNACTELNNGNDLPKEDAMFKLQERFLNIMDQVANLSDEKHRLEHIILQLQTETDTICEYVALYQQQRSLLKKRDEERCAQIKLFEMECDEVKRALEELSRLFLKLAQDKDLAAHLQVEARHNDVAKIKNLLEKLLNSSLINSKSMSLELKNFYPCSCCSGQLIDV